MIHTPRREHFHVGTISCQPQYLEMQNLCVGCSTKNSQSQSIVPPTSSRVRLETIPLQARAISAFEGSGDGIVCAGVQRRASGVKLERTVKKKKRKQIVTFKREKNIAK